jgi:hypothetical protein
MSLEVANAGVTGAATIRNITATDVTFLRFIIISGRFCAGLPKGVAVGGTIEIEFNTTDLVCLVPSRRGQEVEKYGAPGDAPHFRQTVNAYFCP